MCRDKGVVVPASEYAVDPVGVATYIYTTYHKHKHEHNHIQNILIRHTQTIKYI